jgi:hypothetical protein
VSLVTVESESRQGKRVKLERKLPVANYTYAIMTLILMLACMLYITLMRFVSEAVIFVASYL